MFPRALEGLSTTGKAIGLPNSINPAVESPFEDRLFSKWPFDTQVALALQEPQGVKDLAVKVLPSVRVCCSRNFDV